jgi:hypothetical protein
MVEQQPWLRWLAGARPGIQGRGTAVTHAVLQQAWPQRRRDCKGGRGRWQGPCKKTGWVVLGLQREGSSMAVACRQHEEGRERVVALTGWLEEEQGATAGRCCCGKLEQCRQSRGIIGSDRGRRCGKDAPGPLQRWWLPWLFGNGRLLSKLLSSILPRPSLLGGSDGTGENNPRALGFNGCDWGLLIRAALRLGCVGMAAMLGFHAMAMRHASGGCESRARVSEGAWAVKGEVERGTWGDCAP